MKTLAKLGEECIFSSKRLRGGKNRLVICPKCYSKNVVLVAEQTEYVDCLRCPDIRIHLKGGKR